MFHPPATIGLALLPMAWAASDCAGGRGAAAARRAADDDLARYFPAGWQRESLPDWPAAAAPVLRDVKSKWQASAFAAVLQRSVASLRRALHQIGPRRGAARG